MRCEQTTSTQLTSDVTEAAELLGLGQTLHTPRSFLDELRSTVSVAASSFHGRDS